MDLMILNEKFESSFILDTFESAIWTDRYSSFGDFEIYTSVNQNLLDHIKHDWYIWNSSSEHMMIIEQLKIETDIETGNHLIVTGRSLESLLTRRIVWEQTTLKGSIETQIEKLLNENIINPTDAKRKIDNFIFERSENPAIESINIEAQFTGETLYDAIKNVCDSVNLGFKITLNDQNQFAFRLYSGINRSYSQDQNPYVVFSPNFENIINSKYYESKENFKNITLVAGEGNGSSRKTAVVGDTETSGLSRRELYTDARDISSTTSSGTLTDAQYRNLLQQRGLEKLAENKVAHAFDGQVETTQLYRYDEDFFMGDITQIENEYGMESSARIIEFIYSQNSSGTEEYPTFEVVDGEGAS